MNIIKQIQTTLFNQSGNNRIRHSDLDTSQFLGSWGKPRGILGGYPQAPRAFPIFGTHSSDLMAIMRAYANFARRHPDWAAAYFDEHFLFRHIGLVLKRNPEMSRGSLANSLAMEWGRQFRWTDQLKQRRLVDEATAIADDFLQILDDELSNHGMVLFPVMRAI